MEERKRRGDHSSGATGPAKRDVDAFAEAISASFLWASNRREQHATRRSRTEAPRAWMAGLREASADDRGFSRGALQEELSCPG